MWSLMFQYVDLPVCPKGTTLWTTPKTQRNLTEIICYYWPILLFGENKKLFAAFFFFLKPISLIYLILSHLLACCAACYVSNGTDSNGILPQPDTHHYYKPPPCVAHLLSYFRGKKIQNPSCCVTLDDVVRLTANDGEGQQHHRHKETGREKPVCICVVGEENWG